MIACSGRGSRVHGAAGARALHIVQPETVIAWHRQGFRLFWTWKSRHRSGRPAVSRDVRVSIRQMSTANPLWGAPRIHGELLKLGISVSESTVAQYMRRIHVYRHKRGGRFSPTMRARSWLPTSSSSRPSPSGCSSCSSSSPTTADESSTWRHRASNSGLDRTATAKRLSGERGAPVSAVRSRFRLCARRDNL